MVDICVSPDIPPEVPLICDIGMPLLMTTDDIPWGLWEADKFPFYDD